MGLQRLIWNGEEIVGTRKGSGMPCSCVTSRPSTRQHKVGRHRLQCNMHSQLISRQTTNVTLIRFITSLTVDYCLHDNRYQVNVLIWREVLLQLGVDNFWELLVPGSFYSDYPDVG